MKKPILLISILCGLLLFSGPVLAYTINSGAITVGDEDSVLEHTTLANSSEAGELAWVQSVLGPDYTITYTSPYEAGYWIAVDGADSLYALSLNTTPEYFFLKLGTGGVDDLDSHWLYDNVDALSWAVVNISAWGADDNINIGRVSHIGEIDGEGTPIPEPATMLLLGSGLIGLVGIGRRKFFKK